MKPHKLGPVCSLTKPSSRLLVVMESKVVALGYESSFSSLQSFASLCTDQKILTNLEAFGTNLKAKVFSES